MQLVVNPNTTDPDESGMAKVNPEEWTEKGVTDYTLLSGYIDGNALEVYGDGLTELLSVLNISNIPLVVLKAS